MRLFTLHSVNNPIIQPPKGLESMKTILSMTFLASALLFSLQTQADSFTDALSSAVGSAMEDPNMQGGHEAPKKKTDETAKEDEEQNCEESVTKSESNNTETNDNDNAKPEGETEEKTETSSECKPKEDDNDESENEEETPSEKDSDQNKLDADKEKESDK